MNANDYTDYQLPELMYLIEQVRLHVLQHKKGTMVFQSKLRHFMRPLTCAR